MQDDFPDPTVRARLVGPRVMLMVTATWQPRVESWVGVREHVGLSDAIALMGGVLSDGFVRWCI